jgi:hypothetical protein
MEDENDRAPLGTRVADYLDALYAEYDADQAKLGEKRRLKEERTAPRENHALPHGASPPVLCPRRRANHVLQPRLLPGRQLTTRGNLLKAVSRRLVLVGLV